MTIIPKSEVPATKQAATVETFVEFVKGNSPFYKEFWNTVPSASASGNTLERLPLTDHAAYWQANTCLNSNVVTSEQQDGIIFKTGGNQARPSYIAAGTTAKPKVSFYSHAELEGVSKSLATSLVRCGVRQGDKVINLFYAGDMYGSFLLHVLSVFYLPIHERVGAVQLPVAGHVTTESMVTHILEFEGTVVLSTVTTMVKMAELLAGVGWHGRNTADSVRLLLFSGEALYNDQVGTIKRAFPNAELRSLVYGTMDCGVIGLPPHPEAKERFPVADCIKDPRVHQVNRPGMIVDIVREDGTVTTEAGTPGSLVVTNLERRLMPVVRYPSGDRAEWIDYETGLFRVLGRDQTAIRLGPVSIDFTHLREAVSSALGPDCHVSGIQAVVGRQDAKDLLTVLIAFQPTSEAEEAELKLRVAEELGKARPMFKGHVELGLVNPLRVTFVKAEELTVNERSGKSINVVDKRLTTL
ncbi:putative NRPS-like protein biosynthetic cluster [Diaporthe eres]